jgi:soluble lytic murein transglycosylase-like protein
VESGKNPTAHSIKGAVGVMQVMPANAKRCGLPHAGRLWLEESNIDCGARIISEELKMYGNLPDALRAYSGGPKAIKGKFVESEAYVVKVLATMGRMIG